MNSLQIGDDPIVGWNRRIFEENWKARFTFRFDSHEHKY